RPLPAVSSYPCLQERCSAPPSPSVHHWSSLRPGGHPVRHSFPTRRSSDLHCRLLRLQRRGRHPEFYFFYPSHPFRAGGVYHGSQDRKSTRLNSSHVSISYAVFCLKKKMIKRLLLASAHLKTHSAKP